MATTAPAKCFFGSISKHNQCSRPTYVWMCVLYRFPKGGLWRQKRRPNVTCKDSRTGGLWRQQRRQNVSSDLFPNTTNAADQRMYGCVYYIESRNGGFGDKSAGPMLLVWNPVPGVMATTAPAKTAAHEPHGARKTKMHY